MTKELIKAILEKCFRDFIETDKNSSYIAEKGSAKFIKVRIKKEIFQSFGLPFFDIKEGYIEFLTLEYTPNRFYAYPIKITIEKLFLQIFLCPKDGTLTEEKNLRGDYRMKVIQQLELMSYQIFKIVKENSNFNSLVFRYLEIEIKDVVVRLEDSLSEKPNVIGISIKNFIFKPTDETYRSNKDSRKIKSSEIAYKYISISSLSVFLDYFDKGKSEDYQIHIDNKYKNFDNGIYKITPNFYRYCLSELEAKPEKHNYITYNFSLTMNVSHNSDCSKNDKPEIYFKASLSPTNININFEQIKRLFALYDYYQNECTIDKFFNISQSQNEMRLDEQICYIKEYKDYYQKRYYANNKNYSLPNQIRIYDQEFPMEKVKALKKAALIELEYETSLNDLTEEIKEMESNKNAKKEDLLNKIKQKEALEKNKKNIELKVKEQMSIVSGNKGYLDLGEEEEDEITETERIETESKAPEESKPAEPLIISICIIEIDKLELKINKDKEEGFLFFCLDKFFCNVERANYGNKFKLALKNLNIMQEIENHKTYPHIFLINPNLSNIEKSENSNYLVIDYENNKLVETQYRFSIDIQWPSFFFIMPTMFFKMYNDIKDLFSEITKKPQSRLVLRRLRKYFKERNKKFRDTEIVEKILTNTLKSKSGELFRMKFDVNACLPQIVIPLYAKIMNDGEAICLNMGNLKGETKMAEKSENPIDLLTCKEEKYLYDKYQLELTGFSFSTVSFFSVTSENFPKEEIIGGLNVSFVLSRLIENDNKTFVNYIFDVNVKPFRISLSSEQLQIFFINNFAYLKLTIFEVWQELKKEKIKQGVEKILEKGYAIKKRKKKEEERFLNFLVENKMSDFTNSQKKVLAKFKLNMEEIKFVILRKMNSEELKVSELLKNSKKEEKKEEEKEDKGETSNALKEFLVTEIKGIDMTVEIKMNLEKNYHLSVDDFILKDVDRIYSPKEEEVYFVEKEYNKIIMKQDGNKNTKLLTLHFRYVPSKEKAKLTVLIENLLFFPNFSFLCRVTQFVKFYIVFYKVLVQSDIMQVLKKNFEELQYLERGRENKKGINGKFFNLVKEKMKRYPNKDSLLNSIKNVSVSLNGSSRSGQKVYKKSLGNLKQKMKISIEVKNFTLSFPFNEEIKKSHVFTLECDSLFKYKIGVELEIGETIIQGNKTIYKNFSVYNRDINFMVNKISMTMTDKRGIVFTMMENFRVNLISKTFLLLEKQNHITNIQIILSPIKIDYNLKHIQVLKNLARRYEVFKDQIQKEIVIPMEKKTNEPKTLLQINIELIQKEIEKKKRKAVKKFMYEKTYNLSAFNFYLNVTCNIDKCEINFYNRESSKKHDYFKFNIYQTSIDYISNNDPVDGMNMANSLVEIISGKEIDSSQFNTRTMYKYCYINCNMSLLNLNKSYKTFEHIIEPYNFIVRLTKAAKVTRLKVDISSDKMLNINISSKALEILNTALFTASRDNSEEWEESDYEKSVEFQNKTDLELVLTLETNGEKFVIDEFDSRSFSREKLGNIKGKGRNFISSINSDKISFEFNQYKNKSSQEKVRIDSFKNQEKGPFDYSKMKSVVYRLCSTSGSLKCIDVNITVINGESKKKVIFSSILKFKNKTDNNDLFLEYKKKKYFFEKDEPFYVPFDWMSGNETLFIGWEKRNENNETNSEKLVLYKGLGRFLNYDLFALRSRDDLLNERYMKAQQKELIDERDDQEIRKATLFTKQSGEESDNGTIEENERLKDDSGCQSLYKTLQFEDSNSVTFYCVDAYAFRPMARHSGETGELQTTQTFDCELLLYELVISPPVTIENQIPQQYNFGVILYSLKQEIKKEVTFLDTENIYSVSPEENKSLLRISIVSPEEKEKEKDVSIFAAYMNKKDTEEQRTYESHLFNINDIGEGVSLLSRDENKRLTLTCAVKKIEKKDLYQYDNRLFEMVEEKTTALSKKLIFYFDYLVLNRISVKLNSNDGDEPEISLVPEDTSLNISYPLAKNSISLVSTNAKIMRLHVGESVSSKFRLDTIGLPIILKFDTEKTKVDGEIKIYNDRTSNKLVCPEIIAIIQTSPTYPNSTILILEPRFHLNNQTNYNLVFASYSIEQKRGVEPFDILKGTHKPLDQKSDSGLFVISVVEMTADQNDPKYNQATEEQKRTKKLELSIKGFPSDIIQIDRIGEFDVKAPVPLSYVNKEKNKKEADKKEKYFTYDQLTYYTLIRVSVQSVDGGMMLVTFSQPEHPLLEIVNKTKCLVELAVSDNELITIKSQDQPIPFTWRNNAKQNTELVCRILNKDIKFSFSKLDKKEFDEFSNIEKFQDKVLYMSVSTENEGITRRFFMEFRPKQNEEESSYQAVYFKKKIPKASGFNLSLKGIGISFIDDTPQELFYFSIFGIDIFYSTSVLKTNFVNNINKMSLFIKNIQLDYSVNNPVTVLISPKRRIHENNNKFLLDSKGEIVPFIQFYYAKKKTHNLQTDERVEKFQQIDLIIQEFEINLEQNSLRSIFDITQNYKSRLNFFEISSHTERLKRASEEIPEEFVLPKERKREKSKKINKKRKSEKILSNYLFLSAIKFTVNFSFDITKYDSSCIPNFVYKSFITLGPFLAKKKKVDIKLNEMIFQNVFISYRELYYLLFENYRMQAINQIYHAVEIGDLIGEVIKLVDNIGTGYVEFFNEPRKGFSQGKDRFGAGLEKGVTKVVEELLNSNLLVSIKGTFSDKKDNYKPKEDKEEDSKTKSVSVKKNQEKKGFSCSCFDVGETSEGETGSSSTTGSETPVEKKVLKKFSGTFTNPYKDQKTEGVKGFFNILEGAIQGDGVLTKNKVVAINMKSGLPKFRTGKIFTERFRNPRIINQNEPLHVYDPELAEVGEILLQMGVLDYNKIFLFADIKQSNDKNEKPETLILTDNLLLLTENFKEISLKIIVGNIVGCNIFFEDGLYVVSFKMASGNITGFKTTDQKVARVVFDTFDQIDYPTSTLKEEEVATARRKENDS